MNDLLSRKRKFILALLSWASTTLLVSIGKLDGSTYVTGLAWILGLYSGANVATKWVSERNGNAEGQ